MANAQPLSYRETFHASESYSVKKQKESEVKCHDKQRKPQLPTPRRYPHEKRPTSPQMAKTGMWAEMQHGTFMHVREKIIGEKLADTTNTAYLCIWNPTRAEGYTRPGEAPSAPWHFAPSGLGQGIREENRQY